MKPTEWDRAYKAFQATDAERLIEQDHELESVANALVLGIVFIVVLAAAVWGYAA